MCGLVGIAGRKHLDNLDKKVFKDLLFVDTLRGVDSTGVAAINVDKNTVITHKRAMEASDYLSMKKTDKFLNKDANVFIGHNRAATKGRVVDEMAHPFTYGHITLVHNGTLWSHRSLGGGNNLDSDSEAICYALSVEDNPKGVLEDLYGAFAIVWYNSKDKTINFARNDERPLHIGRNKAYCMLAWASENGMLSWIAGRNKFGLDSITALPDGQIWTYDANDPSKNPRITKFDADGTGYYYSSYNKKDNDDWEKSDTQHYFMVNRVKTSPYHKSALDVWGKCEDGGEMRVYGTYVPFKVGEFGVGTKSHVVIENNISTKVLRGCNKVTVDRWDAECQKFDENAEEESEMLVIEGKCHECSMPILSSDDPAWDEDGNVYCPSCSEKYLVEEYTEVSH